jgi:hypothetical protein
MYAKHFRWKYGMLTLKLRVVYQLRMVNINRKIGC